MSTEPTIAYGVKKVADAFTLYRKKYNLKWPQIEFFLKDSQLSCKKSETTLKGYFGIGGRTRSPILDSENSHYAKIQVEILRELNKHIVPAIAFDESTGRPLFDESDSFQVVSPEGEKVDSVIDKDEYRVYYWRHGESLGSGSLTLFNTRNRKAALEIDYSHRENNLKLDGDFTVVGGIVTVRLHDLKQKDANPRSQIVFLSNPSSPKHGYFGTYSTAHRGANMFPTAGTMLLFRKDKFKQFEDSARIKELSQYFLDKQRFRVHYSGFDFLQLADGKIETDNPLINTYYTLCKYEGIYRGLFVNPKKKTGETCMLRITSDAEAEMLVFATLDSKPFKGIVRISSNNRNLIISYDYKEELKDYRMKLLFDISRYHTKSMTSIYGLMCGLELASEEPMASTIVITELVTDEKNIMAHKQEVDVISLTSKKELRKFQKELKKDKVTDFFYDDNYTHFTSVGLLHKLKNEDI